MTNRRKRRQQVLQSALNVLEEQEMKFLTLNVLKMMIFKILLIWSVQKVVFRQPEKSLEVKFHLLQVSKENLVA